MRIHPRRAQTNPAAPSAWATDDRSGFVGNHKNLRYQMQWSGNRLVRTGALVFADQYDEPQRQLGTVMIPPDPTPVFNARVEQYNIDEYPVSTRYTLDGRIRVVKYTPYPVERIVSVQGNISG